MNRNQALLGIIVAGLVAFGVITWHQTSGGGHVTAAPHPAPQASAEDRALGDPHAPIVVIGLPRSGTTFFHNLLAADPANRSPATWEIMYPSPPPGEAALLTSIAESLIRTPW